MAKGRKKKMRIHDGGYSDKVLLSLWGFFIVLGIGTIGLLTYRALFWQPDKKLYPYLTAEKKYVTITPTRGDILDCKGRILATSVVLYDIHMDTAVPVDTLWDNNVAKLAAALSQEFGDDTPEAYLKKLDKARKEKKHYLKIHLGVDQQTVNRVRTMPIFKKGRYKGGYLEERYGKRTYPYGNSAKRTIGYVADNKKRKDGKVSGSKGIEGAFEQYLHGTDGMMLLRRSDLGLIPAKDSCNAVCVNGSDIRTTIDIDIQNIADKALRRCVERSELIEKSCVIVLERRTGAVKAMVNIGRDESGQIVPEMDNYALRNAEAPGSVFKGVVTAALLEDGYITSLEKQIPTFGGKWTYNKIEYNDVKHVGPSRFPSGYIKVFEAFEMSANNPFRQMICDEHTYGNKPSRFIEKVRSLGILDTIDFDIPGGAKPFILDPSMKRLSTRGFWDNGTFPRIAIGYGMELSPLNIVTFYNAIANDGKMMKPYIIETIIPESGEPTAFGPVVMHESICTKTTVDALKSAMSRVTTSKSGTAYYQLKDAICPIAGKTGTAQRVFKMRNGRNGYHDPVDGRESQQGSFVGFFPTQDPEFTAIVVVWSKPARENFYGASYAAPVFKEIADQIYCLNDNE